MNKIFKVIWSEARNAYVVVSEIAKNMGSKSCSTKKLLAMLIATGVMTCAGMAPVMAANLAPDDAKIEIGKDAVVHSESGIAIGDGAEVGTQGFLPYYGIAIGKDARSITYSISIGPESYSEHYSVAIGETARAEGGQDVAIGYGAKTGVSSVAIGYSANAQWNSVAIGIDTKAKGQLSIAIGPGAQTGQEGQTEEEPLRALAIGNQAKARQNITTAIGYEAEANDQLTTAIGYQAKANTIGSIAFGNDTTAEGQHAIAIGTRAKTGSMFAVALGHEAEASDQMAIALGNQAKAKAAGGTALGVEAHAYGIQTVALGYQAQAQADQAIALGNVATASGKQAIAVGYYATASGEQATALGKYAKATGKNTLALGTSAKATTEDAEANIENAIAIGANSKASAKNAAALGNTALATGESAIALGDNAKAQAGQATALGGYATANGLNSTALGAYASAAGGQATAVGYHAEASENHATAIGMYSKAGISGSVALGNYSVANREVGEPGYLAGDNANSDPTWTATLAAASVGRLETNTDGTVIHNDTRQIINVAAGSEDTDAVNVAQLKKVYATAQAAKTVIAAGDNVTIDPATDTEDGHTTYTINAKDTTYSAGNGIKIDANDGNKISVKLKAGEQNLVVDKDGLSLNKTLVVESVNAGGTVINNSGLSIGGNTYVSSSGLNANSQKIINVAAGSDDTDAVNVKQLKDATAAAGKGWKLSTNSGTATTVAPGDTVDFAGDNNVSVSNDGKNVKVSLNNDINVNKITTNNAYVTNVDASNDNSVTNVAYVNQQIAGGALKAGNGIDITDKVVSVKLKEGEKNLVVDENGLSLNLTQAVVYKDDNSNKAIKSTNAGSVADNAAIALGNKVAATGENAIAIGGYVTNGQYISRTNAVGNSSIAIGVQAWSEGDYTVALGRNAHAETMGSVAIGAGSVAERAAGEVGLYAPTGTESATWKSTDGDVSVGYHYKDKDGVEHYHTRQITHVAAGSEDTDAVNVAQLKKVNATAQAAKTVIAAGDNVTIGSATDAEDGHTTYTINAKDTTYTAGNGIAIDSDNNNAISVKLKAGEQNLVVDQDGLSLNKTLVVDRVNAGGTVINNSGLSIDGNTYVSSSGLNANSQKIINVANGTEDSDAVNYGQLKEATAAAGQGWKLSTNGGTATTVAPGDTVDFAGDNNVSVSNDGKSVKVKLNNDISVNSITTNNAYVTNVDANKNSSVTNVEYVDKKTAAAKTEVKAGTNVASVVETKAKDGHSVYTVNAKGTTVTGDANVEATAEEEENNVTNYKLKLKSDLTGISSISNGSSSINLSNGNVVVNNKVTIDQTGKISGVAAGAVTATSTDAVNGSQLYEVKSEAGKHSKVVNGTNTNVEAINQDGQMVYKVNLNSDILLGDLTGKYVNISGKNGTIETTGYIATKDRIYADNGGKLANIDVTGNKISNGSSSIEMDGSNVKVNDKVTIDQTGKISGVAPGEINASSTDAINGSQLNDTNNRVTNVENKVTKIEGDVTKIENDITTIKGDITNINNTLDDHSTKINKNTQDIKNLDNRVTEVEKVAGKHSSVTEGDNITVTEGNNDKGGKDYTVALKKDINLDSVTTGDTVMNNDGLKVGSNVSVTKDAVTAGSTSISNDGLKIGEKTYVSSSGLNANSQKVTNVADGEISATSKDAVNGSQLNATNEQVINNSNRISRLGDRVNKVGAGAAALAALHPMDFDPDDKWSFAAGYGNYAGENAAAVGAYYRPDEKVMFSIGGTVGNGENMVNAGISFALDRTNHVSNSRTALAREVIDLRSQLAEMGAKMAKMEAMLGVIDESKTKLFPDVPANHWAYEYIAKLAGNGILEGYPDGTFGGDRLMTRYEFATMLYRAIEKGAALEERIINEFAPELGRIRVDRISGKDGDRNKIERVRVNGPRSERDHYGSKLK